MARLDKQHRLNVPGDWFVDTRCIDCDVARQWATELISEDDQGLSYVKRQPQTPEEEAMFWRAAAACPTQSIGHRRLRRPQQPPFPYELTAGIHALGYNAESSFGAHSYLVRHNGINVLIDSPRYLRPLAEGVDALGHIDHVVLTHRDDVADADRWAERYRARVWIHSDDADVAPYATDVLTGSGEAKVTPGVTIVPIPGHTRGSVAVHVNDRFLFTGDSLYWNRGRQQLDVFPGATWYSWDRLADSMDRLAALRVDWVFPGHGIWQQVGTERYAAQMKLLGLAMRSVGRWDWSSRSSL